MLHAGVLCWSEGMVGKFYSRPRITYSILCDFVCNYFFLHSCSGIMIIDFSHPLISTLMLLLLLLDIHKLKYSTYLNMRLRKASHTGAPSACRCFYWSRRRFFRILFIVPCCIAGCVTLWALLPTLLFVFILLLLLLFVFVSTALHLRWVGVKVHKTEYQVCGHE